MITGLSSSVTLTWNEHDDVFPAPSVAVHVTVVSPEPKATLLRLLPVPVVAPVSVYAMVEPEQLSVAPASQPVPE